MHRFIHYVILLMGIFITLPSSLADMTMCQVKKSQQFAVMSSESRTVKVATYYKCGWFWSQSCTSYRTMIVYRSTQRQVTRYVTSPVCCDGYVRDESELECIRITDETASTTTDNPPVNQSVSTKSSQPNNSSSRNETTNIGLRSTTTLWTSSKPPSSMTTPTNQKGTTKTDGLNMTSSQVPRGAVILISLLLFFVTVIVLSIVLVCIVYRRRKVRRIQKETDNLHMEPLRDLQLLSETSSNIQHFSPPSAPDDEYAIVDKKTKEPTPTNDYQQSYENTCIGFPSGSGGNDKTKPIIDDVGKDTTQEESNRLTHTYMDGTVCLETNEMVGIPVSMATVHENGYNEVDEVPEGKITSEECYTEVDDMTSSLVGPEGGVQEHDYCYTKFDKSSPGPNECYSEVDDMVPSSVPREGTKQDEYESIGDTYDRLDRGSTPGESDHDKSSKEGRDTSGGKYGILVQSSSVDSPESYDTFQRSVSQTDTSGIDGYEPLLAVPSSGSNPTDMEDVSAYDDLDRAMPKTRRKGKDLLDKLRQSSNTTAYGHLGSSFESDISEECSEKISDENPDMEPIYSNQDVAVISDRDSTYTDMSGRRPGSVVSKSHEKAPENTYHTTMSPTHQSNTYCNVDLENNDQPH